MPVRPCTLRIKEIFRDRLLRSHAIAKRYRLSLTVLSRTFLLPERARDNKHDNLRDAIFRVLYDTPRPSFTRVKHACIKLTKHLDALLWCDVDTITALATFLCSLLARISAPLLAGRINVIPGTTVTVIDPRDKVLAFADREVTQALCYSMRKNGARFLLGEKASDSCPPLLCVGNNHPPRHPERCCVWREGDANS